MLEDDGPGGQRLVVPVRAIIGLVIVATIVVALAGALREVLVVVTGARTDDFPLTILKLDFELAIPAWYSGSLMLFAALLLLLLAFRAKASGSGEFVWWLLLGLGFVYLSADEIATIHERVATVVQRYLETSGVFRFSWLVVGVPAVLLAGALFLPFVLRLDRRTKWLLVAAGAVFVTGAVGCEMMAGLITPVYGFDSPLYLLESTLEECLELAGVTLLVVALLLRLRDDYAGVRLEIS